MSPLLILTNCPDQAVAEAIANAVLKAGLAACVNIMAPCQSLYRWQGGLQSTTEIPLFIKSTAANYATLETVIRQHHPYEIPEIIAFPIQQGLPAYLAWLAVETSRR